MAVPVRGETITLEAPDGHRPSAYCVRPRTGRAAGAIVVAQEVFGITPHVRGICDDYAGQGYVVVAPALYDRVAPGIELRPTEEDRLKGAELRKQIGWGNILDDMTAARDAARDLGGGKVGIIGYCLGGDIAWAGACILGFDAAVCYYGGAIAKMLHLTNTCPVMLHNGTADPWIPAEDQARIDTSGKPDMTIHKYEGIGHAFNNDTLPHRYDAETTRIARERTLAFLARHVAGRRHAAG